MDDFLSKVMGDREREMREARRKATEAPPPPAEVVSPTGVIVRELELKARLVRERKAARAELQRRGYGWVLGDDW